jgi:hypothetical protein
MRVRRLAAGAIALGIGGWLAAGGRPAPGPRPGALEASVALGGGSPEAPLASPPPVLRFALPLGGHGWLLLDLGSGADADLAARAALAGLLGVRGEWPLDGRLGLAALEPAVGTGPGAAPVPEPRPLALVLLGAAGLAGARTLGRRPAGHGPARLAP